MLDPAEQLETDRRVTNTRSRIKLRPGTVAAASWYPDQTHNHQSVLDHDCSRRMKFVVRWGSSHPIGELPLDQLSVALRCLHHRPVGRAVGVRLRRRPYHRSDLSQKVRI